MLTRETRPVNPNDLPADFIARCQAVTDKRPRTVINHILTHGYITTEELKETYGYMLLCGSANRAKSWSCEHCVNWRELKDSGICRRCYWAYPEDYDHVAMRQARRTDILWTGDEIPVYERLKRRTLELQKDIPAYIKEIVEKHV